MGSNSNVMAYGSDARFGNNWTVTLWVSAVSGQSDNNSGISPLTINGWWVEPAGTGAGAYLVEVAVDDQWRLVGSSGALVTWGGQASILLGWQRPAGAKYGRQLYDFRVRACIPTISHLFVTCVSSTGQHF